MHIFMYVSIYQSKYIYYLRNVHHLTFPAQIYNLPFLPQQISIYPSKLLMILMKRFLFIHQNFFSHSPQIMLFILSTFNLKMTCFSRRFTPLFLRLHASISFLHNSSLQELPFITAHLLPALAKAGLSRQ